ncbi:Endochitinase 33 [Cyphellophora attinorum]|uniref:chitinase n=1 Tax=Cyphellophora attinorum TaxID=1664694 RepID=A0A0N0NNV5_9EURO|nr:Endochitinase 33 [Phialophora attinorum]KPI41819.1 Endochitinase 33 [Phialophora attinorum]
MHAFTFTASVLASTLFSVATAAPNGPPQSGAPSGLVTTYYGQNGQDVDFAALCEDPSVDIVPLAFVTYFPKENDANGYCKMNFANNAWASEFWTNPVTGVTYPDVFDNMHTFTGVIQKCQANGKKVLISLGGDPRYSDVSLTSNTHAEQVAVQLWRMFGPVQQGVVIPRPFGNSVIDGVDFDVEGTQAGPYHPHLATSFKALFAQDTSKQYYLSAAPQCPTTDGLIPTIQTGVFDYVNVQFYNNYCGVSTFGTSNDQFTPSFNAWSKLLLPYPNTKLFVGMPAGPGATDAGDYGQSQLIDISKVEPILKSVAKTSNFGGAMLWDYYLAAKNGGWQTACKKHYLGRRLLLDHNHDNCARQGHYHHELRLVCQHYLADVDFSTTTTTTAPVKDTTTTSSASTSASTTWADVDFSTTTTTTAPVKDTTTISSSSIYTSATWGDIDFSTTTTTTAPVKETTTTVSSSSSWADYWGDETTKPVEGGEKTTTTTASTTTTTKPVEGGQFYTWSDYTSASTMTTTAPVEGSEKPTWSDAYVSTTTTSGKPVEPTESSSTEYIWSDVPASASTKYVTVTEDAYVTSCDCTPEDTPMTSIEVKPTPPASPTTIATKPVSDFTGVKPPVATFTGAAAQQSLSGTMLSVGVCVAVAVAGLFL